MKWSRIVLTGLGIILGSLVVGSPVNASNAPANLTVASGNTEQYAYNAFGATTQITIERGGVLAICTGYDNYTTINADITFDSTGSGAAPTISLSPCVGGNPNPPPAQGATFTGNITLGVDGAISTSSATLIINGALTANGHNLAISTQNRTRILGTGTMGSVSLSSQSVIAPGNSPGIINTGDLVLVSGSAYEFELGGTTVGSQYDQINVTGTVDLGGGTLSVILWNSFKPSVGQTFTIINNDGSDAITGTFVGLAEGKTFVSQGYAYTISYVGGSGNDVVLTVVPTPPDTGFMLKDSNPAIVLAVTTAAAVTVVVIARHMRSRKIRL